MSTYIYLPTLDDIKSFPLDDLIIYALVSDIKIDTHMHTYRYLILDAIGHMSYMSDSHRSSENWYDLLGYQQVGKLLDGKSIWACALSQTKQGQQLKTNLLVWLVGWVFVDICSSQSKTPATGLLIDFLNHVAWGTRFGFQHQVICPKIKHESWEWPKDS